MNALFDIQFTRRHITRCRAKSAALRVSGKSPVAAARYLLRTLRRENPQGVYSLVSVAPAGTDASFAAQAERARRAVRSRKHTGERLEVLRAVARGTK